MEKGIVLVVTESGPGGTPNREPRCIIPDADVSSDEICAFMSREFDAKHDDRYIETEPRHFTVSRRWNVFEIIEAPVKNLV